ncbi:MAG: hypothetical protein JXA11_01060 [Phycisphaerae bacterium]|nr:hypothetical protein [Phycisphaerae bacterium]
MAIRVGFGCETLTGGWEATKPFDDPIEVVGFAAVDDATGAVLTVVLVCDVLVMHRSLCDDLRTAVSAALGLDPYHVGIFCTQNHGVLEEIYDCYYPERWREVFASVARKACQFARPAEMAVVQVTPNPAGVCNRRKYIEGIGAFSFYYNFDVRADGQAGCAKLLQSEILGLLHGNEWPSRCSITEDCNLSDLRIPRIDPDLVMDAPADTLMQGLFFRDLQGKPIGSIARWATHPVTSNEPGAGYRADYPIFARRRLKDEFGGGAVFLTGPCGNQAPVIGKKSHELARSTGCRLADELLVAMKQAEWKPLVTAKATGRDVDLPVRDDLPVTREDAQKELVKTQEIFRKKARQKASLRELKELQETIERLTYAENGSIRKWTGLSLEKLSRGKVRATLFAARIGPAILCGLPGEPYNSYSLRLRDTFAPIPLLIAEECNGYLSYIPASNDYSDGGYGPAAAIVAPETEALLLREIESIVHTLIA